MTPIPIQLLRYNLSIHKCACLLGVKLLRPWSYTGKCKEEEVKSEGQSMQNTHQSESI